MPADSFQSLVNQLRAEHFRHSRNVEMQKTKQRLPLSLHLHTHNTPTIPVDLADPLKITEGADGRRYNINSVSDASRTARVARTRIPGPQPPKSWSASKNKDTKFPDTVAWRAQALSLVFTPSPSQLDLDPTVTTGLEIDPGDAVPSLVCLCARALLEIYHADDQFEQIISHVPPHLRRYILRYTSVHSPLSTSKLYALCGDDGHTDGEFVVVGPYASLSRHHFWAEISLPFPADDRRLLAEKNDQDVAQDKSKSGDNTEDLSWEDAEIYDDLSDNLHTFVVLSAPLSTSNFQSLPPTITRIALMNLPSPVPVHRLPEICPLLEVLDFSYNRWLTTPSSFGCQMLEEVKWRKWSRIKIIALRGCYVSPKSHSALTEINAHRWNDADQVKIIL